MMQRRFARKLCKTQISALESSKQLLISSLVYATFMKLLCFFRKFSTSFSITFGVKDVARRQFFVILTPKFSIHNSFSSCICLNYVFFVESNLVMCEVDVNSLQLRGELEMKTNIVSATQCL